MNPLVLSFLEVLEIKSTNPDIDYTGLVRRHNHSLFMKYFIEQSLDVDNRWCFQTGMYTEQFARLCVQATAEVNSPL